MGRRLIGMGVGVVLGCTPTPAEVMDVYEGQTSTASGGSTGVGSTNEVPDGTGTIAEGSAGSGSGVGPATGPGEGTTDPIDSGTTTDPMGTGPGSTTNPLGGSTSSGGLPATCDEIFGAAENYLLCEFDETSCSFAVTTNGNSCTTICAAYGEACLGALDNPGPGGDGCRVQGGYECGSISKAYTICICSR